MHFNRLLLLFLLLSFGTFSFAQVVNTTAQLNNAINAASPGATIILANGTWNNVFININENGNAGNPITVTAQSPGGVLMTGNSRVRMEGSYVTVSGLVFQDPSNLNTSGSTITPIFDIRSCDNCKVLNNKIDAYNGTNAQKSMTFKWILNDGQNNEIAFNSFIGKFGVGSIINDNRNNSEPDFLRIHHNYFAGRRPINELNEDNDQDAIRLGNSGTSLGFSFSEVYDNYFYDFFGEIEVISNKSGGNKYYNNTFREYSGALTLRHGNDCEVYGNYFFANDNLFSGGVRVIGEGHRIYNNYIEGVNSRKPGGSTSKGVGGINVTNGRQNSALNGYFQVRDADIVNNTFVNCDFALRIGSNIAGDLNLAPHNLTVANNITFNSSEEDYEIETSPTGNSVSEGNILDLPENDLEEDAFFHRLTSGSAPINAGVGSYSFLNNDVLDGARDSNFDAGAEEFGANGTRFPYHELDVGVNLGFGASSSALTASTSSLDFGVCGGTRTFEVISNVDWTITEDLPWLTFDVTSGSGTSTIVATVVENTTGADRSSSITIAEDIAGSDGLVSSLSIGQSMTSIVFEIPTVSTTSVGMQMNNTIAEVNAYNDDNTNYWTGNPDTEPEVSITFDLGDLFFLTEIGINFWKSEERTTTFSIAIAADEAGPFTTILDRQLSSTGGGISQFTEQLFPLGDMVGRYVKFIGHGNSSSTNWTSISNVNFYGDFNCLNAATSIFNIPQADIGITLFPVPVSNGQLNIFSESNQLNKIEIFNVAGQRVLTKNGNQNLTQQLDVSHLNKGIYFMNLEGIGYSKFIIQ